MKHKLLTFLFSIVLATSAVSNTNIINSFLKDIRNNDDIIKLVQKTVYGQNVVQISFDGHYGEIGSLQVFNSSKNLVYSQKETELSSSPYYSTINVTDFAAGEYTFVIKVNNSIYTSTIILK